ncbi:uncharacterized protein [Montipora foliosa]|uniref:uncharacterized protein n=1 Tax=Montipora foliosa TaxID=591990 RepID=UPI0035F15583
MQAWATGKETSDIESENDRAMCDNAISTLTATNHNIYDAESELETFVHIVKPEVNDGKALHTSSVRSTNLTESKYNQELSRNRKFSSKGEHLVEDGRFLEQHNYTEKLHLSASVHSELTRKRSLSDGDEVKDGANAVILSADRREKLERLKRQIYDTNLKRKNTLTRPLRGSKSEVQCSTQSQTSEGEKLFPALTEKSLMCHSRGHEMITSAFDSHQTTSLVTNNSNLSRSSSDDERGHLDAAARLERARIDEGHTSVSSKLSSETRLKPSSLASLDESQREGIEMNSLHLATPPTRERRHSFEPIILNSERCRAVSEPGDVGRRKWSTFQELQSRTRTESNVLKAKVQSFVDKPLPTIPSSLRVKKKNDTTTKIRHLKTGTNANMVQEPRERIQGVINMHTCGNLKVFHSDQSWVYPDKSRNKHRYIRGPATPVPPVDFVFSTSHQENP